MTKTAITDLMRVELEAVLADPLLRRSPVQSRLLRFLVEASIRGEGPQLKSYAVAVDGLGKATDFDSQADSYARVQVVRLRRTLNAYYAAAGAGRANRFVIENGGYEVRLVPMDSIMAEDSACDLSPETPAHWRERFARRWFRPFGGGRTRLASVAVLFGLAILAAFHLRAASADAERRWGQSDFPFVAILVSAEAGDRNPALAAEVVAARRSLLLNAARYESIRVSNQGAGSGDYVIDVALRRNGVETFADVLVIRSEDRRVIWSSSELLAPYSQESGAARAESLGALAFRIFQPTGVIHAHERRWRSDTSSPYRCWLRFGLMLQENPFREDAQLEKCSAAWYRATPNHPVAAALHGWAMTSEANRAISASSRNRQLAAAVALIENARAANPNSPLLQIAAMRAHAAAGDSDMVIEAADRVLKLNPDSLDLTGAAGTFLVLYNVDGGERLLDKAIGSHPNPPIWYHIGKVVAAMMKDDPEEAQRALSYMKVRKSDGLSLYLIEAAVAARRGRIDLAKAYRREAEGELPIMRVQPELVLGRLPVAPEVRERLRQWLAPVL